MKETTTKTEKGQEEEVCESSKTRKVTSTVAAGAVTIAVTTIAGVLAGLLSNKVKELIDPAYKDQSDC
jgi:hypothetical protein